MEPVDRFLRNLQDYEHYHVLRMVLTSDYTQKEIAKEWKLDYKYTRVLVGRFAKRLGVKGHIGLKNAYIEFLEEELNK